MVTPANVDATGWYRQSSTPILDGNYPLSVRTTGGLNTPFGIAREASRLSGTAPLGVHFSAGFSASDGVNRDFHNLVYLWNFDDVGAGTWAVSGKSKETDIGGVVGHVFESAGTHTVTLTVIDPITGSTLDTDTFVIVVTAADTTFSGTNTVVINPVGDSDFTGKPTGATEVNSDDIATAIAANIADDTRVLLKRGSSWTESDAVSLATLSTCQVGAYGTGTGADSQGLFSNDPIITYTGSSALFNVDNTDDVRVTNIRLLGDGSGWGLITGATNIKRVLAMDNYVDDHVNGIEYASWRTSDSHLTEENYIVNNRLNSSTGFALYMGSERLIVNGNICTGASNSHVFRCYQSYIGQIGHNSFSGGVSHGHAVKYQSIDESAIGTYTETGTNGLENRSTFTVFANNIGSGNVNWPFAFGPENAITDQRVTDLIIEKNKILVDYLTSSPGTDLGFIIQASYVTARNNIVDATGTVETGFTGLTFERRGIEPAPVGNEAYFNTVYTQDSLTSLVAVSFSSDNTDAIAINNLISGASVSTTTVVSDSSSGTVSNNLDDDTPDFTDPDNVDPLLRDFSLTVSSTAVDFGIAVAVYDDFIDAVRAATHDVGAYSE